MGKIISYDYVKKHIENTRYKLKSDEYKNSISKLELQCSKGHIFKMTWNNFQQGHGCPKCFGTYKYSYEYVKQVVENYGHKLLSKTYNSCGSKLELQCSKGHKFKMSFTNLRLNKGCFVCFGKKKLTHEYVKGQIEKESYKLLSNEYENNHIKLKIQCPKGHKFKMRWNNFQIGQRCPECWEETSHSKPEKEVLEIVKSFTNKLVMENDRTQIINPKTGKNLELDVYIPALDKAIEFNGTYWHSSNYMKYKDEQKIIQCEDKGINLMIIEEQDWINNKKECVNNIHSFIRETI